MNWISGEIVGVLTFLIPGFVAAAVFYSLTSHPKPSAFDRMVLALVLTLFCQAVVEIIEVKETIETAFEIVVAVLIGLCISGVSNSDMLHHVLRRFRVTRETSFPSEWYSAFARYGESSYVVLHLQEGRRLYGYAEEWPSEPKNGHFRIAEAEWLDAENKRIPLGRVSFVLVSAAEVTIVEFLPISGEPS